MAATAVRYLRAVGSSTTAAPHPAPGPGPQAGPGAPGALPRPDLRAVREDERAPVDPARFRRVLGDFASGVTVVTAPAAEGEAGPAGFACQSFASLSLEPPLVSFMVGRTSTTWPRIARAGVFCVNVLSAGQSELCRAFAVSGADKFAGVAHSPAPETGSPLLEGVSAWIDCEIHAVHTGGDHLIVVGRVRALDAAEDEAAPLVFHRGTLGTFSPRPAPRP
ncbi:MULTISPECIES: flavin reductase family protein [unclassified Streptomyces]|uniref:flavin reductase family protein n=1 Tax=unclassified Streptomyces TaxID=2593676 RepID=UPI002DDB92E5|nr:MULTISPECIES: flavin reductase family protein [unclassified Streptomyces]WSA97245.1 flavin reductase family protein [Streptomyces sp. NBC_01795]WSB81677.1 flavin reductase family protein [Streptomyces sp. NBC_01775]WSS17563.1 flavin reductase family protein [Streptomyces sp. NBC_01186]WSS46310.1 flavin reductase family protein [Streptomyces sp. NBC_01187]